MKKWTYLAVAGMMLGTAPVFTGCIDNDEPEGITILRQAKSELLKARAKVEEANARSIDAEAALKEARKEVVAAQAAYKRAQAEEMAAKAQKAQYEAELASITNEEERARLENLIDKLAKEQEARQREADLAAAQLEVDLMKLKAELAKQQAAYEQAMKDLALAQNTLTEAQEAYLAQFRADVEAAQLKVDAAALVLDEASEALTEARAELDAAQSNALAQRRLARKVEQATAAYEAADAAYQLAVEAAAKDFSSIEALETRKAELDAQLQSLEKQLADLNVARTELETSTLTEAQNVEELKAAYEAIAGVWDEDGNLTADATKEYTMPEIKLNFNVPGLPSYYYGYDNWTVAEQKFLYSAYLQAIDNETADNFGQKGILNNYLKEVNSWTRTPNDDAWAKESILQYQTYLKELTSQIDELKAKWLDAVENYQGKLDVDVTQLDGYADLKDAIDAYNEALTAFVDAEKAYDDFREANLLDNDAYNTAYINAYNVYTSLVGKDGEPGKNQQEYDETVKAAREKTKLARLAWEKANAAYNQAVAEYALNPTEENEKAIDDALKVRDEASDAWDKAGEDEGKVEEKARDLMNKKNDLAWQDLEVARTTAYEQYIMNQADEALQGKLSELKDAMDTAKETFKTKTDEAKSAIITYKEEYLSPYYVDILEIENTVNGAHDNGTALDVADFAQIDRNDLRNYISDLSNQLFGINSGVRLVEQTAEEMVAEISAFYMENINPEADFVPSNYINTMLSDSYSYGLVGLAAYYQGLIDVANATLNNAEAIATLKEELNGHLADVDAIIAQAKAEADAANWAYTQANDALEAKFADVDKSIEEAQAQIHAVKPVIDRVTAAISTYLSHEDYDAASVEELKNILNGLVAEAEQARYDAETALLKARERQEKYATAEADAVEVATEDWNEAYQAMLDAQAELQAANEALLAEIDRISQLNEETAE